MDKTKIKDAILKTAGYPESGVVAQLADAMVEAIYDSHQPVEVKNFEPVKETRIQEIKETR
jgi:hypothetical protein